MPRTLVDNACPLYSASWWFGRVGLPPSLAVPLAGARFRNVCTTALDAGAAPPTYSTTTHTVSTATVLTSRPLAYAVKPLNAAATGGRYATCAPARSTTCLILSHIF